MSDNVDPERVTFSENRKKVNRLRFMEVTKTFKQMLETPRVDCMIMTRESFENLKQYCDMMEIENPVLGGIKVYFHQWVGDLIVYGDSRNKMIRRIIESCEDAEPKRFGGGGP